MGVFNQNHLDKEDIFYRSEISEEDMFYGSYEGK